MNTPTRPLTATLADLPPVWPESRLAAIQAKLPAAAKLVVLDDDPTGTQTVYDVPVLTTWAVDDLIAELVAPGPVFYILTNSRSLPLPDAQALNAEIGEHLAAAQAETGRRAVVVSRSDSTLRGHYPGEVDALAEALDLTDAATLIIPFFLEGGRYTIDNIHYVAEDDQLVPAAQTPFARDAAFGYQHSDLCEWVAEKTGGRIAAADVAAITLDDLRRGGPAAVATKLTDLAPGQVAVVNAADLRDLEVLVDALLDAEATGKQFVYRTAASFVQIRVGLPTRPLLTAADLKLPPQGGGLFVVGSYVPKTTGQVTELLALPGVTPVEIAVPALLDPARRDAEIARCQNAGRCRTRRKPGYRRLHQSRPHHRQRCRGQPCHRPAGIVGGGGDCGRADRAPALSGRQRRHYVQRHRDAGVGDSQGAGTGTDFARRSRLADRRAESCPRSALHRFSRQRGRFGCLSANSAAVSAQIAR